MLMKNKLSMYRSSILNDCLVRYYENTRTYTESTVAQQNLPRCNSSFLHHHSRQSFSSFVCLTSQKKENLFLKNLCEVVFFSLPADLVARTRILRNRFVCKKTGSRLTDDVLVSKRIVQIWAYESVT